MAGAGQRQDDEEYPLPRSVECPFCGGTDTHVQSPFGSVMSVAQYYCRRCRTVFEWVKWEGRDREPG